MQTPGKKFSDLVEIEEIKDTDITVVRNETGVKKTPMQKISDYVKQKFIAWVFEDLPTQSKTIPGALKELNSAFTDTKNINVTSTENVGSKYILIGNMVIGFVCAKVTQQVTTINLSLPAPYNEGYIMRPVNSHDDKKYTLTYRNNNWDLTSESQITAGTWLRFPIVYITK